MRLFFSLFSFFVFLSHAVLAFDYIDSYKNERITVYIDTTVIHPKDNKITFVLNVKLEDGWKTYHNTEDIYVSVEYGDGVVDIQFPNPSKIIVWNDYEITGYEEYVGFPIEITYKDRIQNKISVSLPICKNQCLIEEFELNLL